MKAENCTVREAAEDELLDVLRLLDAAMLAIDHDTVADAIGHGDVLVAVDGRRVVGAAVLSPQETGAHVEAIAVQRERRDRGIGRQLVEAACERHARVTADFRRELEPFWESLGFAIERRGTRLWGERGSETD